MTPKRSTRAATRRPLTCWLRSSGVGQLVGWCVMKVLICEADPTIVLDLWALLHVRGHAVCGVAQACRTCLERIALTRPDLVVVDAGLTDDRPASPGLVEVLDQLSIPSILLVSEDRPLPVSATPQAVLRKPFSEAMLANALAQVERRGRLQWSAR
jgi:AmiR/NasT family two-component response regulator